MALRHRRRAPTVVAAIACALLAPSCGTDDADAVRTGDAGNAGNAGEAGAEGSDLLAFTAPLVGGGTFDGASATDRPVAFWFWAPT